MKLISMAAFGLMLASLAATSVLAAITQDLGPDSAGAEVSTLQDILTRAGSAIYPEGRVTGVWDTATGTAVSRFQDAHGITVEPGMVGPVTRLYLNSIDSQQTPDDMNRAVLTALAGARADLSTLLTERAATMQALMATNPAKAWEVQLPKGTKVPTELQGLVEKHVVAHGKVIATYRHGHDWAGTSSRILTTKGAAYDVNDPRVRAVGPAGKGTVRGIALSGQLVADPGSKGVKVKPNKRAILFSPPPVWRVGVVMLRFPDRDFPTDTRQNLVGVEQTVTNYWSEASYGKLTIQTTITDWIVADRTFASYQCDQSAMFRTAFRLADNQIDWSQIDTMVLVTPESDSHGQEDCGQIGYMTAGHFSTPGTPASTCSSTIYAPTTSGAHSRMSWGTRCDCPMRTRRIVRTPRPLKTPTRGTLVSVTPANTATTSASWV